jgi:hypothetical protein
MTLSTEVPPIAEATKRQAPTGGGDQAHAEVSDEHHPEVNRIDAHLQIESNDSFRNPVLDPFQWNIPGRFLHCLSDILQIP